MQQQLFYVSDKTELQAYATKNFMRPHMRQMVQAKQANSSYWIPPLPHECLQSVASITSSTCHTLETLSKQTGEVPDQPLYV